MRAFAVEAFGKAPAVHDLPIPSAEDAFLIRVTYAGVNPIDYKLLDWLTVDSRYPFVIGIDFAGVVERVPAGASDLSKGDRVFGMARTWGAYAEYTAVAPGIATEPLVRIPDGIADEQAAALPVAGLAALGSLTLLAVTQGQRLVVMGAAGAVGGYAVQMASSLGAYVIATVRGDAAQARRLGAVEVYDTNNVDVIEAIHAAHPQGVDAVLDLVNGGDAIKRDAEVIKPCGKVVSTINAADRGWFSQREVAAYNITSDTNPMSSPYGLSKVADMLAEGTITARIHFTADLDGVGHVLEAVRGGGLRGKAVIHLG